MEQFVPFTIHCDVPHECGTAIPVLFSHVAFRQTEPHISGTADSGLNLVPSSPYPLEPPCLLTKEMKMSNRSQYLCDLMDVTH